MSGTILVVEDDKALVRLFQYNLSKCGYEVLSARSGAEFREWYNLKPVDMILLDVQLPDADGIQLLAEAKRHDPEVSVVIMTAYATIERAVKAMKLGAYDFLTKPIDWPKLEVAVKNAVERHQLAQKVSNLERTLGQRRRFHSIVGTNEKMQALYSVIENVAPTNASVMIMGETGTGKELVARAIHALSSRRDREILDVNCAAIPYELMESELFGHERGAFTGAIQRHVGCCERADKGTLFLDEICEMDIGLQAKLLRFIQERYFQRVGGKERIYVDTRIISATNRDPLERVKEGRLREDLYYRLNVVMIQIPRLRDRRDDIPLLSYHFLQTLSRENDKTFTDISNDVLEAFCQYDWPGNVRELENVIAHAVTLNTGDTVTREMLPPRILKEEGAPREVPVPSILEPQITEQAVHSDGPEKVKPGATQDAGFTEDGAEKVLPLSEVERIAIERALRVCHGNVSQVCHHLGISQATLYRKVKEYGLKVSDFKLQA